jgi:hypothetical protein
MTVCNGHTLSESSFLTMSPSDTAELKRNLRSAGFEIYRTNVEFVHLTERVRDNLIMDSGVAAQLTKDGEVIQLSVQVNLRAQASHFPGADEAQLWEHARELAKTFTEAGYEERESHTESVVDPSDPSQSLDTSFRILLRRAVADLSALHAELREALSRRRSTAD